MKFILRFILVLLVCCTSAWAADSGIPKAPTPVTFGVYPVSIYDIDPTNGSYMVSFYAWWRTTDPTYHPEQSIEIVNSRDYNYKFGKHSKIGNEYFTYVHYYAKINQKWNSTYFPFGRQYLTVSLEDYSDTHYIVFKPDYLESKLHNELVIPGWTILGLKVIPSVTKYTTNFGDASTPTSYYSRLSFVVEIKRNGWHLYVSYFIGFFMAAILVHLLYLMNSFPYPGRATMFIGSVFSFVGNKYVLDQKVPPASDFSLVDVIQLSTFFAMLVSVVVCIIAEKMPATATKQRDRMSHTAGLISFIIYTGVIVYYTYKAVTS